MKTGYDLIFTPVRGRRLITDAGATLVEAEQKAARMAARMAAEGLTVTRPDPAVSSWYIERGGKAQGVLRVARKGGYV